MSIRYNLPRLDGAQLAATFAESLVYGIYLVLFIQCLEALWFRSKLRGESMFKPIPATAVILFCTITAHWILDLCLAFEAFLLPLNTEYCFKPTEFNQAERVYLNLPDKKNILTSAFYVLTTLVGDGFMIYRLYIVWSRNVYVILPPTLMLCALAVTGGMTTFLYSQAKTPLFEAAGAWITSCFVLTFICNIYSTSLIAFRISWSHRKVGQVNVDFASGITKIIEILIESAVLYGLCITVALATYVSNSNVQFAVVAINGPVIGIIFCMIVARAHRSVNTSSQQQLTTANSRTRNFSHALRSPIPMSVRITTQIDNKFDPKEFGTPPASPGVYSLRSVTTTGEVRQIEAV